MKVYSCNYCDNPLYFENTVCLHCNNTVGFDTGTMALVTLQPGSSVQYTAITDPGKGYHFCENYQLRTCNWLIPAEESTIFCKACELNRTIPTLTSRQNHERWGRIEVAKHRLIYSLFRLGLPVYRKIGDSDTGVAFDFMADVSRKQRVVTGHNHGAITLNIEEADEAERARHKLDLGERYRTLLGHFRHEIGHYYWNELIWKGGNIEKFHILFGNEQFDYTRALKNYYRTGAPVNWEQNFISPYASSHAWEDWAETWAHYQHMMDSLETAYSFGLSIDPVAMNNSLEMKANINRDPYTLENFDEIFSMWLPLTLAVNGLNRSLGHPDFYPFVISSIVKEKLRFIHDTCKQAKGSVFNTTLMVS